MLFPVPLAALIALLGTSDNREFRGELPFMKGLFIRTQIAGSAICESLVIKAVYPQGKQIATPACQNPTSADVIAACHTNVPRIALAVICASLVGYTVNVLFVAFFNYFLLGAHP